MADTSGKTPFERWQSLVAQWEIAYAHYLDASDAKRRVIGLGGAAGDLEAIEMRALANLGEIKSDMAGLVTGEGRRRGEIKDSFVLGTIERDVAIDDGVAAQARKDTGKP
jgi:hypothetical protein